MLLRVFWFVTLISQTEMLAEAGLIPAVFSLGEATNVAMTRYHGSPSTVRDMSAEVPNGPVKLGGHGLLCQRIHGHTLFGHHIGDFGPMGQNFSSSKSSSDQFFSGGLDAGRSFDHLSAFSTLVAHNSENAGSGGNGTSGGGGWKQGLGSQLGTTRGSAPSASGNGISGGGGGGWKQGSGSLPGTTQGFAPLTSTNGGYVFGTPQFIAQMNASRGSFEIDRRENRHFQSNFGANSSLSRHSWFHDFSPDIGGGFGSWLTNFKTRHSDDDLGQGVFIDHFLDRFHLVNHDFWQHHVIRRHHLIHRHHHDHDPPCVPSPSGIVLLLMSIPCFGMAHCARRIAGLRRQRRPVS